MKGNVRDVNSLFPTARIPLVASQKHMNTGAAKMRENLQGCLHTLLSEGITHTLIYL